jgi:hypothetical protein
MNRPRTLLALGLWLLAINLAAAQSGGGLRLDPQKQMYEDIEVLRRLLTGRLETPQVFTSSDGISFVLPYIYDPNVPGTVSGSSNTWLAGERADLYRLWYGKYNLHDYFVQPKVVSCGCEGVYLKGQGVIYTLTMPPPERDPRPQPVKPADKTPSEWERIRQQVRGDKGEPEGKAPERKEPSLADVVLKVLADNGYHFAQLGDNESLTVAITFRRPGKSSTVHTGEGPYPSLSPGEPGGVPGPGGRAPGSPDVGVPGPGEGGTPDGGPRGVPTPGGPGGFGAPPSSARDYELLGDLHLRQGKLQEAISTFQRGVELNPESKQLAALYRKLAQAHLQLADHDGQQKAIEKATEYLKRAAEEVDRASKPGASSALPAKLIISAPKKLLDQVGAGKISFEDFKKTATVDYVTFTAPEKKSGK